MQLLGEHATQLAREGLYSKATASLQQVPMAPPTAATHASLAALNPDGAASGAMPAAPAGPPLAFTLDPEVFYQTCTKIKRGRAHGPSGWRMEHYALVAKYCVVDDAVQASPLFKVFEAIANGRVPAAVRPFFAGGRLVGLTKPNGSVRPIVIGESLRRLVGKAAIQQKRAQMEAHFAPVRVRAAGVPAPAVVEAAQLGVSIDGGLEEIVHAVSVALQCHPHPVGPVPQGAPPGWVCVSIDFRNFFNAISRPAVFRELLASPDFADLHPLLSMLYSKADPAKLWADLGEQDWDDILSREGVHQGCPFGSFLAALGLQPILQEVASHMTDGMLLAYMDDVKIVAPVAVAHTAYERLKQLAQQRLNIEEVPAKGSIMWEGEGAPDVSMFPAGMPGVAARISHDRHLGVFLGDSRLEAVGAVKAALMQKFEEKAEVLSRLPLISDPQVKFQLLKCCISTRPGFWLRTMSPDLTADAAAMFDSRLRDSFKLIHADNPLPDLSWNITTLLCSLGGQGITSATSTAHHAHYASWAVTWSNISRMFPQAITLNAAALTASNLPFAVGLCDAHASCLAACTSLTLNPNGHPLPHLAPSNPSIPDLSELGTRLPKAQKRFAAVTQSARWLEVFDQATVKHRALMLSLCQQGANFAFNAVPSVHHAMLPSTFITAQQLRLRLPLSVLAGVTRCVCGAAIDCYGDHCLSCIHFTQHRTPWHNLIVSVASRMARRAGHTVSHDANRPRHVSQVYSPNWCPDFTSLHGSEAGTHFLVDVTCPSVVKATTLPAAASLPRCAALAAEAGKRQTYGAVAPHVTLPFIVEHGGALGEEAMKFFKSCRTKVRNELDAADERESTWSTWGFSNFHFQQLSVANLKGQGHFFATVGNILRARGGLGGLH